MPQPNKHRDKTVTREVHRLFWHAMLHTKHYFVLTIICHLPTFLIMSVFVPLQIAYGIQAIITRDFDQVSQHAVMILVATVVANIIFAAGTWAFNRNGVYGGSYLQKKVFANYLKKDYDFFANSFIGSLGSQANNLRQAFTDYNRIALFDIPRLSVVVIANLIVIAYHSLALALISIGCVVFVQSANVLFSKYRLKYRREVSEADSKLSGVVGDALSHGTVVKSFGNEQYETKRLQGPMRYWERKQLQSWDWFTPQNFTRQIMLAITMCLLLIVSGNLYQSGSISIAIVALVQIYVIRLVTATIETSEIIKQYEIIMGRAYHPVATMLVTNTINDSKQTLPLPKQAEPVIQFNKVNFRYPEAAKNKYAVKNFSLEIKHGEKIGLVGHSGGGKTTVTKLLLRFMDTTKGEIRVNGVDIKQAKQSDLRKMIAYVPQEPLLFHRSIIDNIAYAQPNASKTIVKRVAKAAFVDEFVSELPTGYDSMVGERGVKLSGGQRQRVAIARALLKDAPILVLDEATSALDSQSESYIQKALWKLMKNRTALVIAHRLSTIQKLDRIVVVDQGKIVQVGTHDELLQDKNGIYATLWAHQSGGYLA